MGKILGIVGLIISIPSEFYQIWHFFNLLQNSSKYLLTGQWTVSQYNDAVVNNVFFIVVLALLISLSVKLVKD